MLRHLVLLVLLLMMLRSLGRRPMLRRNVLRLFWLLVMFLLLLLVVVVVVVMCRRAEQLWASAWRWEPYLTIAVVSADRILRFGMSFCVTVHGLYRR